RTTFGRHHSSRALEAFDGVLIESVLPLRDAWRPSRLVTDARRTANPLRVARRADSAVQLFGIFRQRQSDTGCRPRRLLGSLERRVVLTGHGDTCKGPRALIGGGDLLWFALFLLTLARCAHDSGKHEQQNRDCNQNAEHQTEDVEKVAVLLAHRFTAAGSLRRARRSEERR